MKIVLTAEPSFQAPCHIIWWQMLHKFRHFPRNVRNFLLPILYVLPYDNWGEYYIILISNTPANVVTCHLKLIILRHLFQLFHLHCLMFLFLMIGTNCLGKFLDIFNVSDIVDPKILLRLIQVFWNEIWIYHYRTKKWRMCILNKVTWQEKSASQRMLQINRTILL